MKLEQYLEEIVKFLQSEVKKANAKGLIVGLSGGIDSAVAALLIKKAFPNNYLTLIMPCFSPQIDLDYAQKLVAKHNLKSEVVNLDDAFLTFKKILHETIQPEKSKIIMGNLKSRLRMNTLYAYAQNYNYLVVGTDNADEWHIGYFTKYGDGAADLLPLVHLLKQDIFSAAKILAINDEIIVRTPTASLWEGQTDEQEMQFSYHELDQYLLGNTAQISQKVQTRIKALNQATEHKRSLILQAPKWNRS